MARRLFAPFAALSTIVLLAALMGGISVPTVSPPHVREVNQYSGRSEARLSSTVVTAPETYPEWQARLAAEEAARVEAARIEQERLDEEARQEEAARIAAQRRNTPAPATASAAAPGYGAHAGPCGRAGTIPATTAGPLPSGIPASESGYTLDAWNCSSTASGKYGVLDTTWAGFGGYPSAWMAPESVQDEWAANARADAGCRPWAQAC